MNLSKISIFSHLKLQTKFLILLILVSSVPLILCDYIWFNSSRNQIIKSTSSTLATTTQEKAQEIENYLTVKSIGMIIHSQTESLINFNLDKATSELKFMMLQDQDITELTLLDSKGKELIHINRQKEYTQNELGDESQSPAFKVPTFTGAEQYVSPLYIDNNNEEGIYISTPIVKPNTTQQLQNLSTSSIGKARTPGEVLGVLKANFKLTTLLKDVAQSKIGQSGHIYVVDSTGTVVAHPSQQFIPNQTNLKGVTEVNDFIASINTSNADKTTVHQANDELGQPSLSAHYQISPTNWGVIAEIPLSDTLSEINQVVLFALLLFFISLTFVIIASIVISQRIVYPIKLLNQGATLIGRGQFDSVLNIKTGDEIEDLAREFNSMAENLKRSIYQISAERNTLSIILSGITDAVISVDLQRRIITFNKAAENLTGLSMNTVLGKPIDQVIILADAEGKIAVDSYIPIRTDGYEGVVFNKQDLKMAGASGKSAVVNLIVGQITEGARINLGAILTLHDITEEFQLEEMKLDFVAMAAHELRTPLTSLRGYTYILLRDYKEKFEEKEEQILNRINISTQRLAALVENLLSITKIEKRKLSINTEPLDWVANVEETIEEIIDQAKEKQTRIELEKPMGTLPKVSVDKFRINEVLTNLLANAINYTPDGGMIKVWFEQKPNEIITHIKDTGEGIPREALPHLFTKFFRVNGRLEQGSKGTGLGLYISKSIVEMHGGKIWAESEGIGKGSTFSFSLPMQQPTSPLTIPTNTASI